MCNNVMDFRRVESKKKTVLFPFFQNLEDKLLLALRYFDDKGYYENKALTSKGYCHVQSDFS